MKRLIPFALAFVLVGQGCLKPAAPEATPSTPSATAPAAEDAAMDDHEMEGEPASGITDGSAEMNDGVAVFKISGKNFSYSPNRITVKKGQKIRIEFTSESGFHDLVIDEFKASTMRVNTGGNANVEFTPTEAGTFEFYCSVGQHRANGMVGTLVVTEDDESSMKKGIDMEVGADVMMDHGSQE
jgi:plastocyanin